MNYCQQAAEGYEKMLVTEYNIVIKDLHGFQLFTLYFTKDEFKHSSGIHKSTTTDERNKEYSKYAANVIFEKALNGEVDIETIAAGDVNGVYYGNQSEIVKRIYEFPYLEDYFDKADSLYVWNKNKVGSSVVADYLIELPSKVYPGDNIHLFLGTSNAPATSNQTIQDSNRVNLSNLKFYKEYGLRLYTEFSNSKNLTSKLKPLKILYKEKVEYKFVGGRRIEQSFTRQICDENFEEQMQKKGGFFPLQSSNIMQVTFNSPYAERIIPNNGAAVLASPLPPRPTFGQALTNLINKWAEKIGEGIERRRRELKSAKEEIVELKQALSERDEQLAQKDEQLNAKDNEIVGLQKQNVALMADLKEKIKLIRVANSPKTLSQKMNDATKRSRDKKAAASPRPKPTDHNPTR